MPKDECQQLQVPLIGEDAPFFRANTTLGPVSFPEDYRGKWVIFFTHSGDFTPVSTTEFIRFAAMQQKFKKLNTELLGLSIDSIQSHIAWFEAIREKVVYKNLKNVDITFPVIEDLSMEVSRKYGLIHPHCHYTSDELLYKFEHARNKQNFDKLNTELVDATFLIDPRGKIRAILYYPSSNGRNVGEIKRLLLAIQKFDRENVFTPENWIPGDDVVIPEPSTWIEAKKRQENPLEIKKGGSWFLCLKEDKQD